MALDPWDLNGNAGWKDKSYDCEYKVAVRNLGVIQAHGRREKHHCAESNDRPSVIPQYGMGGSQFGFHMVETYTGGGRGTDGFRGKPIVQTQTLFQHELTRDIDI